MDQDKLAIHIGKNIAKYRVKMGLTQAQLAERVDLSPGFLSRAERGEKTMKVYTLYQIAEALGVSCDVLLYPENNESHLRAIYKMLQEQPDANLAMVEDLLRVCCKHFPNLVEKNGNP